MGAQKLGDKYNYEIAAFLKTNLIDYPPLSPLDFTRLHFNPNPSSVFSDVFQLTISIDLLASDSLAEFICECKHSDQPRPLGINSTEFKESLLEFIGLESYRLKQFRAVTYLLIINMPKKQLEREISNLRNDPEQWPEYLKKLTQQAKQKWNRFNAEINTKFFLSALNNLLVIEIDSGRLEEARKYKKFQDALVEIVQDIERKEPKQVPVSLSNEAQLQLRLKGDEEELSEAKEVGFTVKISPKIIDQIVMFQSPLQGNLVCANADNLPFLKTCEIVNSQEICCDNVALLITEAINDLIEQRCGAIKYISLFYPKQYDIYFAKKSWALQKIKSLRNSFTGSFSLLNEDEVGNVPPYVSVFLIKETKRLMEGIIIDSNRIVNAKDF
jgi:hypothetical protein